MDDKSINRLMEKSNGNPHKANCSNRFSLIHGFNFSPVNRRRGIEVFGLLFK